MQYSIKEKIELYLISCLLLKTFKGALSTNHTNLSAEKNVCKNINIKVKKLRLRISDYPTFNASNRTHKHRSLIQKADQEKNKNEL